MERHQERDTLIVNHIGLVEPIARAVLRRLPPSFELDDLVSSGMLGLIEAAATFSAIPNPRERFRCRPEERFKRYARGLIARAILAWVRRQPLFQTRSGAVRSLGLDFNEPIEETTYAVGNGRVLASNVKALQDHRTPELIAIENQERENQQVAVIRGLAGLSVSQAQIVALHYSSHGTRRSKQKTAARMGRARSSVTHIRQRALRKLSERREVRELKRAA